MRKLKTQDVVALGFMTIALFLGAGNIIFPPEIGLHSGQYSFYSEVGFLIAGVGLPMLTLIVIAKTGEGMEGLGRPLGRIGCILFCLFCTLSAGPLYAIPRSVGTSFDIGIVNLIVQRDLFSIGGYTITSVLFYRFVFSACFFFIATIISLYPGKILDIVGKYLGPIKITIIFILCIAAIFIPAGASSVVSESYKSQAFGDGLIGGYQTLDTLGAIIFGTIIIGAIRGKGIQDKSLVKRYTIILSISTGILLSFIYVCLFKLGLHSSDILGGKEGINGAMILQKYASFTFGSFGGILLAILITVACLVTAVGLTIVSAEYFSKLTKLSYKMFVFLIIVFAFTISLYGLSNLLNVMKPILLALYPIAVVVVLFNFVKDKIRYQPFVLVPVVIVTFIFGIFDCLSILNLQNYVPDIFSSVPLTQFNMSWIVPALTTGIVLFVVEKGIIKKKELKKVA